MEDQEVSYSNTENDDITSIKEQLAKYKRKNKTNRKALFIMSIIIIVLLIFTIVSCNIAIKNSKNYKTENSKQETNIDKLQKDLDKANQTIMEKDKKIQELLEEINKKLEGENKRGNYYPNNPTPNPQGQNEGVKYF